MSIELCRLKQNCHTRHRSRNGKWWSSTWQRLWRTSQEIFLIIEIFATILDTVYDNRALHHIDENNTFYMCINNKNVVFSTFPLLFRGFVIYLEYNYFYLWKDEIKMAVTYTKLWHILIDKGMKKKDLQQAADLTNHTMLKLRNNENITTETIGKINRYSIQKKFYRTFQDVNKLYFYFYRFKTK